MNEEIFSCLIVDDEPAAHHVLKNYIAREPQLELVGECYNVLEMQASFQERKVDLLFLDIHMPEITGLDFLKNADNPPKTILTTAYSEHALESYDYGVVDYLLKPISYPRFQKSLRRFLSYYNVDFVNISQFIEIKVDSDWLQIPQAEIEYVQSFGNYVKVFVGDKFYLASSTTQEIALKLSPQLFVRTHKSYIVNSTKVSHCNEKELIIGDTVIPIGITYKRELFRRLQ